MMVLMPLLSRLLSLLVILTMQLFLARLTLIPIKFFFFQAEDGIRYSSVTGVQTCALPISAAHPVAPSNISALLSGIVLKAGIYGMARMFLDGLGVLPSWAGLLVLVVGVASAVLGVLYALMEHDLKRLLAYHSIENIGIILIRLR